MVQEDYGERRKGGSVEEGHCSDRVIVRGERHGRCILRCNEVLLKISNKKTRVQPRGQPVWLKLKAWNNIKKVPHIPVSLT